MKKKLMILCTSMLFGAISMFAAHGMSDAGVMPRADGEHVVQRADQSTNYVKEWLAENKRFCYFLLLMRRVSQGKLLRREQLQSLIEKNVPESWVNKAKVGLAIIESQFPLTVEAATDVARPEIKRVARFVKHGVEVLIASAVVQNFSEIMGSYGNIFGIIGLVAIDHLLNYDLLMVKLASCVNPKLATYVNPRLKLLHSVDFRALRMEAKKYKGLREKSEGMVINPSSEFPEDWVLIVQQLVTGELSRQNLGMVLQNFIPDEFHELVPEYIEFVEQNMFMTKEARQEVAGNTLSRCVQFASDGIKVVALVEGGKLAWSAYEASAWETSALAAIIVVGIEFVDIEKIFNSILRVGSGIAEWFGGNTAESKIL